MYKTKQNRLSFYKVIFNKGMEFLKKEVFYEAKCNDFLLLKKNRKKIGNQCPFRIEYLN